jgi:hypothetical protein
MCWLGWDSSKTAHKTVTYIEWHIPDVVLIQFSWWRAHGCPKHVQNINKHTRKESCDKLVIYKDQLHYFTHENANDRISNGMEIILFIRPAVSDAVGRSEFYLSCILPHSTWTWHLWPHFYCRKCSYWLRASPSCNHPIKLFPFIVQLFNFPCLCLIILKHWLLSS